MPMRKLALVLLAVAVLPVSPPAVVSQTDLAAALVGRWDGQVQARLSDGAREGPVTGSAGTREIMNEITAEALLP